MIQPIYTREQIMTKTYLRNQHPVLPCTDLLLVLLLVFLDGLSEVLHIFGQDLMLLLELTEAQTAATTAAGDHK